MDRALASVEHGVPLARGSIQTSACHPPDLFGRNGGSREIGTIPPVQPRSVLWRSSDCLGIGRDGPGGPPFGAYDQSHFEPGGTDPSPDRALRVEREKISKAFRASSE